jgi:hypothetical protein
MDARRASRWRFRFDFLRPRTPRHAAALSFALLLLAGLAYATVARPWRADTVPLATLERRLAAEAAIPTVPEEMEAVESDADVPFEESLGEGGLSDAPFRRSRGPRTTG